MKHPSAHVLPPDHWIFSRSMKPILANLDDTGFVHAKAV
jgi:hypothetical protein